MANYPTVYPVPGVWTTLPTATEDTWIFATNGIAFVSLQDAAPSLDGGVPISWRREEDPIDAVKVPAGRVVHVRSGQNGAVVVREPFVV